MNIKINAFHTIIISFLIYVCGSSIKAVKGDSGISSDDDLPQDVDAYTKILLDNEEYSIASVAKHPKQILHKVAQNLRKGKHRLPVHSNLGTHVKNFNGNRLKVNEEPQKLRMRPSSSASLAESRRINQGKKVLAHKRTKQHPNHKYRKKIENTIETKSPKRRFAAKNYNKIGENMKKYVLNNQYGNSYTSNPATFKSVRENVNGNNAFYARTLKIEDWASKPSSFSDALEPSENPENLNFDYSEQNESSPRRDNDVGQLADRFNRFSSNSDWVTYNSQIQNLPDTKSYHQKSGFQNQNEDSKQSKENSDIMSSTSFIVIRDDSSIPEAITPSASLKRFTSIPTVKLMTFEQVDIIHRSPSTSTEPHKTDVEKLEDQLREDESEADDTSISFNVACDQVNNDTCWVEREVGDVLTLSLRIDSSKNPNSFQVRWFKVYQEFESKKGKHLELEPGKLPWNMVSGSEGREMRLNPVTNSDIDPNCITAKVFLLNRTKGKTLFTHLKKLAFRIDIPITDMGRIYAGEELSVNIENFISLPERGNLIFDWALEISPHQLQSLPSNVKVSNSGRSIVLKELRKGRMGVLSCVIYSTSKYAVAKRRFNILNIGDNVKRRSPSMNSGDIESLLNLKQNLRCRRVIRRSQEEAIKRIEDGVKPKSRKKRFRRRNSDPTALSKIDCEPLKKKLYSRWIRSLFGNPTTQDPRVMTLEKLFELSENGDGTLDDVIPHEIHYVEPKVEYVSGTAKDRSAGTLPFTRNCSTNADCSPDGICVIPERRSNSTFQQYSGGDNSAARSGYCSCRPEFYGDGFTCHKIPAAIHREKRLKRQLDHDRKEFSVPEQLFYEPDKLARMVVSTISPDLEVEQTSEFSAKVLAYEEQESFLLSECIDDKDCNMHASCVQPTNGHPYCKCRPGFRGNGIFCWEIIDYVPPEENFIEDEDISIKGPVVHPDELEPHLASRTPTSEEMEDEF